MKVTAIDTNAQGNTIFRARSITNGVPTAEATFERLNGTWVINYMTGDSEKGFNSKVDVENHLIMSGW